MQYFDLLFCIMNNELKITIECFNKTNVTRYKLFVQWKLFQNFFWPSFPTSILYRDSLRRSTFCLDLKVDSANGTEAPLKPKCPRDITRRVMRNTRKSRFCQRTESENMRKKQERRTLICKLMMVLVDGTVHGDGYIIPIVIVCKLCKQFTL